MNSVQGILISRSSSLAVMVFKLDGDMPAIEIKTHRALSSEEAKFGNAGQLEDNYLGLVITLGNAGKP